MNINGDFRIIVNANHGAFMKNTKTQIKLKPIFFFENCGHTFVEIAMILTCANIQRKILMFAEVGDSESLRQKIKARAFYEYLIYIK